MLAFVKKLQFVFLLIFLLISKASNAQTVDLISSDSVLNLIHQKPDSGTTVIINFWATWCGPCIHEMPYFIKADSLLKGENVQFIFISFDKTSAKKSVAKYITVNNVPGLHYILSYTNLNDFINAVDPKWEGGIPYTTVITHADKKNKEGSFEDFSELWHFIRD